MKKYNNQEAIDEATVFTGVGSAIYFEHHYNQDENGRITDSTIAACNATGELVDAEQFLTSVIGKEAFDAWLNRLNTEVEENWREPDEQDRGCDEYHRMAEEGEL